MTTYFRNIANNLLALLILYSFWIQELVKFAYWITQLFCKFTKILYAYAWLRQLVIIAIIVLRQGSIFKLDLCWQVSNSNLVLIPIPDITEIYFIIYFNCVETFFNVMNFFCVYIKLQYCFLLFRGLSYLTPC